MKTNKKNNFYILFILMTLNILTACNYTDNDSFDYPLMISKNKDVLSIQEAEVFLINPDYEYPRHYYIKIKGDSTSFNLFIKRAGLLKMTDENIKKNNNSLSDYTEKSLWYNGGINNTFDDIKTREAFNFSKKKYFSYAGFIKTNSSKVVSYSDKYNGKIIFEYYNNTGYIFIELLLGW